MTRQPDSMKPRAAKAPGQSRGSKDSNRMQLEQSDEELMFEQMARALLEFGGDLGLSDATKRAGITRALSAYGHQPYRLPEALQFQELLQVSEVLGRWYREPRWLDEASQPLPLPLQGVRSFTSLCDGLVPADDLPSIVQELLRQRILIQDSEGRLLPRRRVAGTSSPHPWMLNRVPAISRALYSTVAHNCQSATTGEETLCERGTTVTIAKHMAGEFNRQVKRIAHGMLDRIDDLAHSAPYQAKGESIQAGVEVFAYVDSSTRRTKS